MAKHHIVQNKYLTQWRKSVTENQLNIYLIPQDKYMERGPGCKLFWRKNFNILDEGKENKENFYLPEKVAANIDSKGIKVIREIDGKEEKQLEGPKRCYLSYYIALQYVRTPRFREKSDKFIKSVVKYILSISSPRDINLSKIEFLKEEKEKDKYKNSLEKISKMSGEEIKKQIFKSLNNNDIDIRFTNTEHSKQILKIEPLAKYLFDSFWLFLVAPKDTYFVTSDNPCFMVLRNKKSQQPLFLKGTIMFFPLKPDICIAIMMKLRSINKKEYFLRLEKKDVHKVNQLVFQNSYQCLVAKDEKQLRNLTKNYKYKNYRKSRDVIFDKINNYVISNIE